MLKVKPIHTFLIGTLLLAVVFAFALRAGNGASNDAARYDTTEMSGSVYSPFLCI
jgi:hypothetical protein